MNTKRILISGGASGIGLEAARHFASLGTRVVIFDMSDRLDEALASLSGDGHTAFKVDVSDSESVNAALEKVHSVSPLDALVVSAGIVSQDSLLEISPVSFAKVMSVNVIGVQNVIAPVARKMIAEKLAGSIVVLGSVAAFNGGGLMGKGAYAASKAALLGLVRSYARELAPFGIRINTVAPGATETPMTQTLNAEDRARILAASPMGRFLDSSEIVAAIAFLAQDGASAVTGQTLHANGGSYFG